MTEWYNIPLKEVVERLKTDIEQGLTHEEAKRRLGEFGKNLLISGKELSEFKRFLSQFMNPLVITLLIAAVIATLSAVIEGRTKGITFSQFTDTFTILAIVIVNAILGYLQERKGEKALEALKKFASQTAKVIREGELSIIPAEELVPGDLVVLNTGDRAPADIRLIEEHGLAMDESILTGESILVDKKVVDIKEKAIISEQCNMIFSGTVVGRGRGIGIVIRTGMNTEIGRISKILLKESLKEKKTPLEQRLEVFSKWLLIGTILISVIIFFLGWINGKETLLNLLLVAVSLAVAVIPEGLPAITTITLALGVQRMAKLGAIIRKLSAVETLGSATVICSDKTGTLTMNEMRVEKIFVNNGTINTTAKEWFSQLSDTDKEYVTKTLLAAILASSCEIRDGHIIGDPSEGAIMILGEKLGLVRKELKKQYEIIKEFPFTSERKRMSVIVKDKEGNLFSFVKGGCEIILNHSNYIVKQNKVENLSNETKNEILTIIDNFTKEGLRVLAVGIKKMEHLEDNPEDNLTFMGMIGLIDPPRDEVPAAIKECHNAGIKVVMITGDHINTGINIAKKIGMWKEGDVAVNGLELEKMSDEELAQKLNKIRVYGRVSPEQKLRIVRLFKQQGEVVAVTGDGVNDAPALKEADIGVAMGKKGSDVSKEASDMVLVDDNFATIVQAIKEGRTIYANIQKFIFFLLSSNAALCIAIFMAYLLKWPPILTPLMILWINLVTNGLPALALGIEPHDPMVMKKKPRGKELKLLSPLQYAGILIVGIIMAASALWYYQKLGAPTNPQIHKTGQVAVFMILALSPMFHAFNCRSDLISIFKLGLFSNLYLWGALILSTLIQLSTVLIPQLSYILHTNAQLTKNHWFWIIGLSFLILFVGEIYKLIVRVFKFTHIKL